MSALYSLAACIIVLAAYAAGYIRGHRRGREPLDNLLDEIDKQTERDANEARDRRWPVGSNEPVRWDDTQPTDAPTEYVQPTKPWRQE